MWVTVAIIGFVVLMAVGNFMAAKPKAHEVRLGELRMTARKLGLNPRLIACPDWLNGKQLSSGEISKKTTKGMVAAYTLINDDWQLPRLYYLVKDGQWHRLTDDGQTVVKFNAQAFDSLNGQAINLPALLLPTVRGLALQSNSIRLYWEDERVATQITDTEALLNELKTALHAWADAVMASAVATSSGSKAPVLEK